MLIRFIAVLAIILIFWIGTRKIADHPAIGFTSGHRPA